MIEYGSISTLICGKFSALREFGFKIFLEDFIPFFRLQVNNRRDSGSGVLILGWIEKSLILKSPQKANFGLIMFIQQGTILILYRSAMLELIG